MLAKCCAACSMACVVFIDFFVCFSVGLINANRNPARIIGANILALGDVLRAEYIQRAAPWVALDKRANGFPLHDARKAGEVGLFHVAARCFSVNPTGTGLKLHALERFSGVFVAFDTNGNAIVSSSAF